MIEVFPVMLFILGWHPDKPAQTDLQRPEIIFLSMEECERDGAQMAQRMTEAAANASGMVYQHRCFDLPAEKEFEDAFARKSSTSK
ncbi:MAG: hypothetical protein AAFQ27_12265 [Pseudomonadota bacterium]